MFVIVNRVGCLGVNSVTFVSERTLVQCLTSTLRSYGDGERSLKSLQTKTLKLGIEHGSPRIDSLSELKFLSTVFQSYQDNGMVIVDSSEH